MNNLGLNSTELYFHGHGVFSKKTQFDIQKQIQEAIDMREQLLEQYKARGIDASSVSPLSDIMDTIDNMDRERAMLEAVADMIAVNNAALTVQLIEQGILKEDFKRED